LRLDLSMPGLALDLDQVAEVLPQNYGVLSEKEMRQFQKNNLIKALTQTNWKVSGVAGAAELLGIRPTTLADRIRTLNIKKPVRH